MRKILALSVAIAALLAATTSASGATVRTMSLGATFVVRGQTGSLDSQSVRAVGLVVVRGKWAGGSWHVLTTTRTDAHGDYRVVIKPRHRGLLAIRITPPDKRELHFLLRVV